MDLIPSGVGSREPRVGRRLLAVTLPAIVAALVAAMALVEAWVRLQWDERRGRPGFYLSDPVLGQRLAPGYDGWFAGVPVRINSLGFRDEREYRLEKPPGTFRILVFGDSVTFGHGTLNTTTYPYLLGERLKAWRPDVNWEVWNLGVPGYNTAQELAYLKEVGPRYKPDLVIVGFFPNDIEDNEVDVSPSWPRRWASAVQRVMQRHLYSYELYKRAYLTLAWRLFASEADRLRLEHLASEDDLLAPVDRAAESPQQALTSVEYFDDEQVHAFVCKEPAGSGVSAVPDLRERLRHPDRETAVWLQQVRDLQQLGRAGTYRLMFFINMAPRPCGDLDRFYDDGTLADEAVLLEVLGEGVPAVSAAREFLHYRPSQMPAAGGHALGNPNRVKADVLFRYLSTQVLPPLLPPRG